MSNSKEIRLTTTTLHNGAAAFADIKKEWKLFTESLKGTIYITIFEKGFLPWGDVFGRASIPVERLKNSKEHSAWYPIEFDPTSKKPNSSSSSANKPEVEQQQAPTVSGTINIKIINPMSAEEKQAKHEVKKKKRKERKKKPFRELYDIKDTIGKGAHGVVVRITEKADPTKEHACKILSKADVEKEDLELLRREVKLHRTLRHRNIIRLEEVHETVHRLLIVMELVKGGELFDLVSERGFLNEDEAALIIYQIVSAVAYMHESGIVHRDLKPENILCTREEHPVIKIIDFGASKSTSEQLKTFVGTPSYLSPEIIQGKPYGMEVDVWAIGVITYIVLSGFQPFEGDGLGETMTNIMQCRYSMDMPEFDPVSDEAKDFISRIFKVDPSERPTAAQLLEHPWLYKIAHPAPAASAKPAALSQGTSIRKLQSVRNIQVRQNLRHEELSKRKITTPEPSVD